MPLHPDAPVPDTSVYRSCLRCEKRFKAPTKYIRLCPACTRFAQTSPIDEDWMLME